MLNADSEDQIPVYRLYNPNAKSGAHHFTTDKAEYAWLAAQGWKEEGIAFYTSSADRLPKDDLPLPALPELVLNCALTVFAAGEENKNSS